MPHQCKQAACPWWRRRFRLRTAFVLVAEDRDEKYEGDVDARDRRRISRAGKSQARGTPIAVHEEPVAGEVEQVGADHAESDRLDDVHRLEVAAEGAVEEQRRQGPEEGADVWAEQFHDARVGADGAEQRKGESE